MEAATMLPGSVDLRREGGWHAGDTVHHSSTGTVHHSSTGTVHHSSTGTVHQLHNDISTSAYSRGAHAPRDRAPAGVDRLVNHGANTPGQGFLGCEDQLPSPQSQRPGSRGQLHSPRGLRSPRGQLHSPQRQLHSPQRQLHNPQGARPSSRGQGRGALVLARAGARDASLDLSFHSPDGTSRNQFVAIEQGAQQSSPRFAPMTGPFSSASKRPGNAPDPDQGLRVYNGTVYSDEGAAHNDAGQVDEARSARKQSRPLPRMVSDAVVMMEGMRLGHQPGSPSAALDPPLPSDLLCRRKIGTLSPLKVTVRSPRSAKLGHEGGSGTPALPEHRRGSSHEMAPRGRMSGAPHADIMQLPSSDARVLGAGEEAGVVGWDVLAGGLEASHVNEGDLAAKSMADRPGAASMRLRAGMAYSAPYGDHGEERGREGPAPPGTIFYDFSPRGGRDSLAAGHRQSELGPEAGAMDTAMLLPQSPTMQGYTGGALTNAPESLPKSISCNEVRSRGRLEGVAAVYDSQPGGQYQPQPPTSSPGYQRRRHPQAMSPLGTSKNSGMQQQQQQELHQQQQHQAAHYSQDPRKQWGAPEGIHHDSAAQYPAATDATSHSAFARSAAASGALVAHAGGRPASPIGPAGQWGHSPSQGRLHGRQPQFGSDSLSKGPWDTTGAPGMLTRDHFGSAALGMVDSPRSKLARDSRGSGPINFLGSEGSAKGLAMLRKWQALHEPQIQESGSSKRRTQGLGASSPQGAAYGAPKTSREHAAYQAPEEGFRPAEERTKEPDPVHSFGNSNLGRAGGPGAERGGARRAPSAKPLRNTGSEPEVIQRFVPRKLRPCVQGSCAFGDIPDLAGYECATGEDFAKILDVCSVESDRDAGVNRALMGNAVDQGASSRQPRVRSPFVSVDAGEENCRGGPGAYPGSGQAWKKKGQQGKHRLAESSCGTEDCDISPPALTSAPRSLGLRDYVLGKPYEEVQGFFAIHKKELGSGQFGLIRKCKEIGTGHTYACKSINKKCIMCPEDAEDLRKEVSCLMMLRQHPTVVTLRRTFEDSESIHIVMDLMRGGDLLDRITAKGQLAEPDCARICRSLVEALLHCHCLGILHRDIKPENILLKSHDSDCDIKLVDFGVATFFEPGVPVTDLIGTPEYMAPEVLKQSYGPEADIWSAGVVLYVALSGIPPFWASSRHTVAECILRKDVSFKSTKWANVSEECKDLIKKMLHKDPELRISATEILAHPWVCRYTSPW